MMVSMTVLPEGESEPSGATAVMCGGSFQPKIRRCCPRRNPGPERGYSKLSSGDRTDSIADRATCV